MTNSRESPGSPNLQIHPGTRLTPSDRVVIRTEPIVCPLCQADDYELFVEAGDGLYDVEGSFRLVRCRRCTMVYLNPRPVPDDIPLLYPMNYAPHRIPFRASLVQWMHVRYASEKRARFVTSLRSEPGSILDVGCGTGDFLLAMRRRGWQVAGVEPSSSSATIAQSRGLNVSDSTLEQLACPDHHFDLLTLWDVLEHVADPIGALREAHRVLRPGGMIVISTPDLDSLLARMLGSAWAGLDIPRHLCVFSNATLRSALELTGFHVVARSYFTGGHAPLILSLRILVRRHRRRFAILPLLSALVASLPGQIACYPLHLAIAAMGRGPTVTMVGQRSSEDRLGARFRD